jgi:hypothetical protein
LGALPAIDEADVLVVCLRNPIALAEVHPEHSEQSAEIFAIVRRCDLSVCSSGKDSLDEQSDYSVSVQSNAAKMSTSVTLSNFLSLHNFLDHKNSGDSTAMRSGELAFQHILSIRQVLMLNTSATTGSECISHISLEGLVIRKETVASSSARTYTKKRRKDPNLLVVLRDEAYADTIALYVPACAAQFFIPGFVVQVSGVSIKASANQRKTYLEYGYHSVVGELSLFIITYAPYCNHFYGKESRQC